MFAYVLHFWSGPELFAVNGQAVTLVQLCFALSLPLWALKQYLNMKQLVGAMLSMDLPPPAHLPAPTAVRVFFCWQRRGKIPFVYVSDVEGGG